MNTTTAYFPNNLKALDVWILWKLEPVNGRTTKVPYNAKTLRKASSTNPETWSSFNKAMSAYRKYQNSFNGIGVVISEESGLVFIDIDHCISESGTLDERAEDVLSACEDTYSELSQSGTGIHVFGFGSIPRSFKNSTLNVEMYSGKRFCAMTGNAFNRSEIAEIQPALTYLYNKYRTPEKAKNTHSRAIGSVCVDDNWILEKASKHGRFRLLYSGAWREAGFESQSEADYVLCMVLAFWANADSMVIDRIFRSSGLYRAKWERQDYKQETIERACASIEETFSDYTARKKREEGRALERVFLSQW